MLLDFFAFGVRRRGVRSISTIKILRGMVPRRMWQAILRETCDWRHIFAGAAARLEVPEEELLSRVAEKARLPFVAKVPVFDLQGGSRNWNIASLRRCGAVPVINQGLFAGYICLDPAALGEFAAGDGDAGLFIAPWLEIARTLDKSEQDFLSAGFRAEWKQAQALEQIARHMLFLVAEEVRMRGAREFVISWESKQAVSYTYSSAEGSNWRGIIDERARKPLVDVLERLNGTAKSCLIESDPSRDLGLDGEFLGESAVRLRLKSAGSPTQLPTITPLPSKFECPREPLEISQIILGQRTGEIWPLRQPLAASGPAGAVAARCAELELQSVRAAAVHGCTELEKEESLCAAENEQGKFSVLVIDDNTTFAKVLERFFEKHQLTAKSVRSADAALHALSEGKWRPDLIVCDIHMPGMNGLEFLRCLRRTPSASNIPVIILTSDDDVETQLHVLRTGADAFLTKSSDPRLLGAQALRLIERRKAA